MSENPLDRLEHCLERLLARLRSLQQENAVLKDQLQNFRKEMEDLKREHLESRIRMERMQNDRIKIRSRVDRIRENLSLLEEAAQNPEAQVKRDG